jgi:hypothetical protein
MKKSGYLAACLLALTLTPVLAQPVVPGNERPLTTKDLANFLANSTNSLPKFDLDFPGGIPEQLVKAVEKMTGKPLNAVIPDDCKDLKMPAFSVKNVTVAQLFEALAQASQKNERFTVLDPRERSIGGNGSDVYRHISHYGFKTEGVPTENSIWYFYWDRGDERAPWQVLSSTVCKFYQLGPYLEAGYTVDDITTAVETGWKMLGVTKPPEITYHKDTKVLIAVGEEDKVNLIGDVLKQLSQGKPREKSANKQTEKSKTE